MDPARVGRALPVRSLVIAYFVIGAAHAAAMGYYAEYVRTDYTGPELVANPIWWVSCMLCWPLMDSASVLEMFRH